MGKPLSNGLNELLDAPEPARLGAGRRLGTLSAGELDSRLKKLPAMVKLPPERRQLVRALVLLWHDHLDAAHSLAQENESPDGSFVHAIMHRREPDAGNAKYWFRRVGNHPAYPEISRRVTALLQSKEKAKLAAKIVPEGRWDAMAFVDACDQPGGDENVLRAVQKIEFEVLLGHLLD